MKSNISLRTDLRQTQTMAPALVHSLKLLEKPLLELSAVVKEEIASNPILEQEESSPISIDEAREEYDDPDLYDKKVEFENELPDSSYSSDFNDDFSEDSEFADDEHYDDDLSSENEFSVLSQFAPDEEDYLYQAGGNNEYSQDEEEKRQFMYDSISRGESLQEHLIGQIGLDNFSSKEIEIAEEIIGSIDERGYLVTPLAEIAQALNATLAEVESVLMRVQEFDPCGVGARSLTECLLIQLNHAADPKNQLAKELLEKYPDLLAERKLPQLLRLCDCTKEELSDAIAYITQFSPTPGYDFASKKIVYILPDIEVEWSDEEQRFVGTVLNDYIPEIHISKKYLALLDDENTSPEVKKYISEKLRSAEQLQRELSLRESTLKRVTDLVVAHQQEFFTKGIMAMKPYTMLEIADELDLHETTISRAVAGKYVKSPQGITELRQFFVSGVQSEDGDLLANSAVKELLRSFINDEDPHKPLSDSELVKMFKERGVELARRTVAKYRDALKIPSSTQRKRI
jgi:RNA polymerase sigma-54 factor